MGRPRGGVASRLETGSQHRACAAKLVCLRIMGDRLIDVVRRKPGSRCVGLDRTFVGHLPNQAQEWI